ncbi:MAG: RNA-dependent DNA polymerase [Cyclobacteriaceae bacterium]|nr:RNA-dependent DNA polymerase [Cyclobacteriaceae bacterium]
MKNSDWFKIKKYPHIGSPLTIRDREWVERYIKDPVKVKAHSFSPFIHKAIKVRKYRRETVGTEKSKLRTNGEKIRHIFYANHLDSNIYGYYADLLSEKYEKYLESSAISSCVTAYRRIPLNPKNPDSRNKCNIDFANDVFNYIRGSDETHLVSITLDIKSFFDSLNHKILKRRWKEILGSGADLPEDHYNIFKNITKFSYIEENDIFSFFKSQIIVETKDGRFKSRSIDKIKYLKEKKAIAFCNAYGIKLLRESNYIRSNKYHDPSREALRIKGIPQGSPISAVLANIYLTDLDMAIQKFVGERGGLYNRYSDDLVVICKEEHKTSILEFLQASISDKENVDLEIQTTKTKVFHFIKQAGRFQCFEQSDVTGLYSQRNKMEYLGFTFDGENVLLKSSSLAGYYRKMKSSIRRGKFYSLASRTKSKGVLFKGRLYKRFTHLGSERKRLFKKSGKNDGQWVVSHRYDWGNFLTYSTLAARIMSFNSIKEQTRKTWKNFHRFLKE